MINNMRFEFGSFVQLGVSFETREALYDFLEAFRCFLDESVPIDNFNFQDIKLFYSESEYTAFGDKK